MQTPASTPGRPGVELLVFSDDWGRHPSSCQHLVRTLLPRFEVVWVNTIGTRRPRLDRLTLRRAAGKLKVWLWRPPPERSPDGNPRVLDPLMWPSFRSSLGRRLNRRQLTRTLGGPRPGSRRVVVTTIPLVADLVGRVAADRWVYYCVDDLSEWPGLDARTLRDMERRLVASVDDIVAVSRALRRRMRAMGRQATLLTHGIDLDHWRRPAAPPPAAIAALTPPLIVFWGVVDRRLSVDSLRHLSDSMEEGTIVLIGPENEPDPSLRRLRRVAFTGPLAYRDLPAVASAASVLVMPYADMPATRALQPLKLKEYLATGRPVVVSDLPAVEEWRDACDVVGSAGSFARVVLERLATGTTPGQQAARRRLADETWSRKAEIFARLLLRSGPVGADSGAPS